MLFYCKRSVLSELAVAALLVALAIAGMRYFGLSPAFNVGPDAVLAGCLGAAVITAWTFAVQQGYALVRGSAFAKHMTESLAQMFDGASVAQVTGAFVAAASEELFFRGLIQGRWGIWAGAFAFMLAHIGKKDIRIIGYWSIFQGLGFGLVYEISGNMVAPMIAHGLFDMGAMIYFRLLMNRRASQCASW